MAQTTKIQAKAPADIALQQGAMMPSIRKKGLKPDLATHEDEPDAEKKPEPVYVYEDTKSNTPHETLAELLDRIFNRSAVNSHYIVPEKPLAARLATVTQTFPIIEPKVDEVILQKRDQSSGIKVRAGEITFVPKAEEGTKTASGFTKDDALAMALIASRDPEMLENGVELTGTAEQQALLRAAIDDVNALLPQGKKLAVQGDNVKPALKKAQDAPKSEKKDVAPIEVAAEKIEEEKSAEVPVADVAKETPLATTLPETKNEKKVTRRFFGGFKNLLAKSEEKAKPPEATKKAEPATQQEVKGKGLSRRGFLSRAAAAAAVTTTGTMFASEQAKAADLPEVHTVELPKNISPATSVEEKKVEEVKKDGVTIYNTNTKEKIFVAFDEINTPSCRAAFNGVCRDSLTRQTIDMDPALLKRGCDIIKDMRSKGHKAEFLMINSGFRCAATNKKVGGVPNSLHTKGKAIDIWVPEVSIREVHASALAVVKEGGLGYYINRDFIHMDNGKTTQWTNYSVSKWSKKRAVKGKGVRKVGAGKKARKVPRNAKKKYVKGVHRPVRRPSSKGRAVPARKALRPQPRVLKM